MDWTFGIITGGYQEVFIEKIINSIEKQNIPNYEIIIIGSCNLNNKNCKNINFDENIRKLWITKKKNIITDLATFENIVYMHDYIVFEDNWYKCFKDFGNDWDVCMNPIKTIDNHRYRDWTLWMPQPLLYNDHSKIKEMYVSGLYFCSKKSFMSKYRFNENLCWGQGEDLEWSCRIRNFWNYKCNEKSKVKLLKFKEDFHGFYNYILGE
jgi:hypothetical protein